MQWFVFGGFQSLYTADRDYNDLIAFDFHTLQWSPQPTTGCTQPQRAYAYLAVVGDQARVACVLRTLKCCLQAMMFGGLTEDGIPQDTTTYVLDLSSFSWSCLNISGPAARALHSVATYGNQVCLRVSVCVLTASIVGDSVWW